jgi:hypothetical protein
VDGALVETLLVLADLNALSDEWVERARVEQVRPELRDLRDAEQAECRFDLVAHDCKSAAQVRREGRIGQESVSR